MSTRNMEVVTKNKILQRILIYNSLGNIEKADIAKGQQLLQQDIAVSHIYFIDNGLVSLSVESKDGNTVEVAAIGADGVCGIYGILHAHGAFMTATVQIPGIAYRVPIEHLRIAMSRRGYIQNLCNLYLMFTVELLAINATCYRLHHLMQRCCRRLLIAHDSVPSDTFPLTHEVLAAALGVQRAGVSLAARDLQRNGLIRYTRGSVTVMNRSGLEAAACECYSQLRSRRERLFRF